MPGLLRVTWEDVELKDPNILEVNLINRGRRDTAREDFDQALEFGVGVRILAVLRTASGPNSTVFRAVAFEDDLLKVGPGLIPRHQSIKFTLLASGRKPVLSSSAAAVRDVDVEILPTTRSSHRWSIRVKAAGALAAVAAMAGLVLTGLLIGHNYLPTENPKVGGTSPTVSGSPVVPSNSTPPANTTVLAIPKSQGARSVTYSPDGKYLAAADANGHVFVWPVGSGTPVNDLADPGSKGVNSVAFNPASSVLAAGDANGNIYLWGGTPRHVIGTLTDPDSQGVRSVLFSADDIVLVAGDANGHVYVWPVNGGTPKEELLDPGSGGVNSVAFEASNQTIAAGDNNGHVYLWLYQPTPGSQANPGSQGVLSVAYSPDDKFLAAADKNGHIYIRPAGS
jgi:WD40 repeat protein